VPHRVTRVVTMDERALLYFLKTLNEGAGSTAVTAWIVYRSLPSLMWFMLGMAGLNVINNWITGVLSESKAIRERDEALRKLNKLIEANEARQ